MANNVLYGFMNLKHLFSERVSTVGVDTISTAILDSVAEHNRQMAAMSSLFVTNTNRFKVRYQSASDARLQPLDNNGRARPILPSGYYEVAFPIQMAGSAWGSNRVSRIKMTVEEANRITAMMISADIRWMRDHILAALYNNADWTFSDEEHGSLTIKPLANNDSVLYAMQRGQDVASADNHFFAQAAAIADDANPFPTIYADLVEHSENSGQVVVLVPTNLVTSIKALTSFYPAADPNIQALRLGTDVSYLAGTLGTDHPGILRGYADGCWIVEWMSLPDNYMIAVTTDGEKPIAMREEAEAELQGFQQVAIREDHPFWESQWERRAGFGAWNRVGALVYRIGNASYAIPTGYDSPMP